MAKIAEKYEELNSSLDKKVSAGMEKTKQFVEMWQDGLKYYFSDQLKDKRVHKNWDWVIINYIMPACLQEIAKLSMNAPRIIAHPLEDSDIESSDVWQAKLQWDWRKGLVGKDMRLEQIAALLDGRLFGYWVSKVYWDDKVDWDEANQRWTGDVRYRLWHPAEFWASADEKIEDGDCGTVRYVPLDWAKNRWPEFAEDLELEAEKYSVKGQGETIRASQLGGTTASLAAGLFGGGSEKDISSKLKGNYLSQIVISRDRTSGAGSQGQPTADGESKMVRIEEIYFRDYSSTERTVEQDIPKEELAANGLITEQGGLFYNAQTSEQMTINNWPRRIVRKYHEPKFPKGRFVVRCGHTILNPNEDDQKYLYSQWPFVVVPHYLLPHLWQGMNAVEMYKSAQDMLNVSVSYLFNNTKMFGNPKIAVENDAIALNPLTKKHYKIGAGAGAIIQLVRGGLARFKILPPTPPSAGTMMLYRLFSQEFKNLTGLQSIARGEQLHSRATATEAQHLAMSAHDRVGLQSTYVDEWIREMMGLVAEITQANYDLGRWIRIVGEDQIVGAAQITQKLKSAKFDIDIEPASTLPFDEDKKRAHYLTAYEILSRPMANPLLPDLLRTLGISNWKKILSRHQAYLYLLQITQLYDAVKAGKMAPQDAVKILFQKTLQISQEGAAESPAAGGQTGGQRMAGGAPMMQSPAMRRGQNAPRV